MTRTVKILAFVFLAVVGGPKMLVAGSINDAAAVLDACKATGYSESRCLALVRSSNWLSCFQKCGTKTLCFDTCALKDYRGGKHIPWGQRGDRPRLAADFVGLSEADLVKRFGPPIKVMASNSPDGKYRMLVFSEQAGAETFFAIFQKDGVVSSGMHRGVAFDDSQSKKK